MSAREEFRGPCHGGPHDGEMMARDRDTLTILKPLPPLPVFLRDGPPAEQEITTSIAGRYLWNGGFWRWEATS